MKITIPKPCHENWENMSADEKGRFCSVCSKTVHDFTGFTDRELADSFTLNDDLCGRFREDQLGKNLNFSIAITLALGFWAVSSTLASVKAQEIKPPAARQVAAVSEQIGKVAICQPVQTNTRVMIGAPRSRPAEKPMILLDRKEISDQAMKEVKPEHIETVNTLSPEEALKKFGKKGKNGVILITTKRKYRR
ncbi:hypothetical protein [Chryseobacterium pennipullorum]|nr:hypothetical protein [Chryseobacterium pennipullorum]